MRYSIVVLLGGESKKRMDVLREEIARRYKTWGALKLPAHMTVESPFDVDDVTRLDQGLIRLADQTECFFLQLGGFQSFETHVWFLDVLSDSRLLELRARVGELVTAEASLRLNDGRRAPHFHITLAYKDVDADKFFQIKEYLNGQTPPIHELTVDHLCLLIWNGDRWDVEKIYPFVCQHP